MSWLSDRLELSRFNPNKCTNNPKTHNEVKKLAKELRSRNDIEICEFFEIRNDIRKLLNEMHELIKNNEQRNYIPMRSGIIQLSEDTQQNTADMNSGKTLPRTEPIKTLRIEDDKVKVDT